MTYIKLTEKIKINGQSIPAPLREGYQVTTSTFVNAGRNAYGTVIGEVVGRNQYKIEMKWNMLTAEQYTYLMGLVKDFYFNVTFDNPETLEPMTIKMYKGDTTAHSEFFYQGTTRYINGISMNFIDVGEPLL